MEWMQPESKHTEWSGTLVIIRDVLIFLMFLLAFALIYMVSPELLSGGASAKATAQTSTAVLAESNDPTTKPTSTPQANAVLVASTAMSTQTPSLTPEPTPSPTPDPADNGDFSAMFPAYDTGVNALYSYQTDAVKIAIDKVQSDGVMYFVADVYVKSIDAFKTAFAKDSYGRGLHEMPLKVATDNNAVFAVSGDYYGAREQGVVVRNGILYRDVMGDDVCILGKDGKLSVYQKSSFSPLDMLDETVWQAWAFGPALVQDGAACDTSSSRIKVKNPRSAIGSYEPGHYCFIVVDGRQNGYSTGMTLDELANTFVSLGCVTAYNLDGGATAMMVFNGAVISQPTNGGRSSSDIIYF